MLFTGERCPINGMVASANMAPAPPNSYYTLWRNGSRRGPEGHRLADRLRRRLLDRQPRRVLREPLGVALDISGIRLRPVELDARKHAARQIVAEARARTRAQVLGQHCDAPCAALACGVAHDHGRTDSRRQKTLRDTRGPEHAAMREHRIQLHALAGEHLHAEAQRTEGGI